MVESVVRVMTVPPATGEADGEWCHTMGWVSSEVVDDAGGGDGGVVGGDGVPGDGGDGVPGDGGDGVAGDGGGGGDGVTCSQAPTQT